MMRQLVVIAGTLILAHPLGAGEPFPPELTRWVADPVAPIFTGVADQWDARIRERGWIVREGDGFKLWYTGYDGSATDRRKLGYATSADGVRWNRHAKQPLVADQWIEDVCIVRDGERYVMFAEGEQDRMHWFTSPDGLRWTRQGRVDIRKRDGQPISDGAYGTPTLYQADGKWYLFYERSDLGVWVATTADFRTWTHLRDDPVLSPGPALYDRDLIAMNQIIRHDGRYYALYHGSAKTGPTAKKWSTALAVSDDLITWTKYPQNPLLPIEQNVSSGIFVPDGPRWLLYTMHPEVRRYIHK